MSDIYIDVAASGVVLSDRESSGQNSSPTLRKNHHTHKETTLSHDFMVDPIMGAGEVR
jgi:hypothetical protein